VESFIDDFQFTRKLATANICYHTTSGCRWETIRTTGERWGQGNDSLVAAIARLGEKGWEAVSATPATAEHRPTVLLKRVNLSETPGN
jgi:hypothetical protein